ncbi:MAG: hypothetical protein AAFO95_05425 [Cyanobacteria bacterium J06600_6]
MKNSSKKLQINEITINPELKGFIPALATEEFETLKLDIEINGLREYPLVWDKDGEYILVDGHNRLEIMQGLHGEDHEMKFYTVKAESLDEIKGIMINRQLSRRNLSFEGKRDLMVKTFNQSGMTQAEFIKTAGISRRTLNNYIKAEKEKENAQNCATVAQKPSDSSAKESKSESKTKSKPKQLRFSEAIPSEIGELDDAKKEELKKLVSDTVTKFFLDLQKK